MYGWQDEKHDWEFIANLFALDIVHGMKVHFSVKKCKNCGAYMIDGRDESEPDYVTPKCLESLSWEDPDGYIIHTKSGRVLGRRTIP